MVRKVLRLPAPHFLVRPTTLHCFVYFQVNNNGVCFFLDYVEVSAGRPLRLSSNLEIFDPNLLVLSFIHIPHSSWLLRT